MQSRQIEIGMIWRRRASRFERADADLVLPESDSAEAVDTAHTVEGEDAPRLETCDQSWLYLRIAGDEVVQTGGERVAQNFRFGGQALVFDLRELFDFECAIGEVARQPVLAFNLGGAAGGADEVGFELPEIVLALGVHQSEDDARVVFAEDVRHAEIVAIDRHRTGELFGFRIASRLTTFLRRRRLIGSRARIYPSRRRQEQRAQKSASEDGF